MTYPRYRDARKSARFLTKQERKLKSAHSQTLPSVRGSKLKDTNGKSSLFGHFRSNNLNIPPGRLAAIAVRGTTEDQMSSLWWRFTSNRKGGQVKGAREWRDVRDVQHMPLQKPGREQKQSTFPTSTMFGPSNRHHFSLICYLKVGGVKVWYCMRPIEVDWLLA